MTEYAKLMRDEQEEAAPCGPPKEFGVSMRFLAEHLHEWCENDCRPCNMYQCARRYYEAKIKPALPSSLEIEVRYHGPGVTKIEKLAEGDWIDLRAAEDVSMKAGDFRLISLGVSMKLPEGYEAHIIPRSSTYKTWHIIQTNHMGLIDNSYCGDNDIWMFPALAFRDTEIRKNDRICQFRIVRKQPAVEFVEVDKLDGKDRGGFGSTGTD